MPEKLKKVQNDVNFIRNMGLDELPQGFGTFQSQTEIDGLYARTEGGGPLSTFGMGNVFANMT